jgi:hypothetical protein
MRKAISSAAAVVATVVLLAGCIADSGDKATPTTTPTTNAVTVGGYLTYQNESRHGEWFVEVVQGEVETVKVLHTNADAWTPTDYHATAGGIIIQSTPNPLSIGDRYRVTLRPENTP